MTERLPRQINPQAENPAPEAQEYMEAHLTLGELKRQYFESNEKILRSDDLVEIDRSLRGNSAFEEDRSWIRKELIEQTGKGHDGSLAIISHLARDDKELAKSIFESKTEQIKSTLGSLQNSANRKDASWESRQRLNDYIASVESVAREIGGEDYIPATYEKIGYNHPLEEPLRDSNYNYHTIKILHLKSPDVTVNPAHTPVDQWNALKKYFDDVAKPAKELQDWRGESINQRRAFLQDQVSVAAARSVNIINQLPAQAMALMTITKRAVRLEEMLQQGEYGWGYSRTTSAKDITVPFSRIDKTEELIKFARLKNQEKKKFPEWVERDLIVAGIEKGSPELVKEQVGYYKKFLDELDKKVPQLPRSGDAYKRQCPDLQQFDAVYAQIEAASKDNEGFQEILSDLGKRYKETLLSDIVHVAGKDETNIVQQRLEQLIDPGEEWDKAMKALSLLKDGNTGQGSYNPTVFARNCTLALESFEGDVRTSREGDLYAMAARWGGEVGEAVVKTYFEKGRLLDATRVAGAIEYQYGPSKEILRVLVESIKREGRGAVDVLLKEKNWSFGAVSHNLAEEIKSGTKENIDPSVIFFDEYLQKAGDDERYAKNCLTAVQDLQQLVAWSSKNTANMPAEHRALIEDRAMRYTEKVWEQWQQGAYVDAEDRYKALKTLIAGKQDESIMAVSLGPKHEVHLAFAHAEVAVDQQNHQEVGKYVQKIGALSKDLGEVHEGNYKLSKLQNFLKEGQLRQIGELSVADIAARVESGQLNDREAFDSFIGAGRYKDIVKVFGTNLSESRIEQVALAAIKSGDAAFAHEFVSARETYFGARSSGEYSSLTAELPRRLGREANLPNLSPDKRSKIVLFAKAVEAGSDPNKWGERKWHEVTLQELYSEAIDRFVEKEMSEEEVLLHLHESFEGTGLYPLLRQYVKVRTS